MSERNPGVEVAFGSIQRRLAELGHDEVDLLLTRGALEKRPIKQAVALASEARDHANAAVTPGTVAASHVRPSPKGPLIHLDQIDTRQEVDKWLTAFASFVESAGWSGVLGPAGTTSEPRWFHEAHAVPKLTAYVGYEVSDPLAYGDVAVGRSMSWGVDPATTASVCDGVSRWAARPNAEGYLVQYRNTVRCEESDVTRMLIWALDNGETPTVRQIRKEPLYVASVSFGVIGQVISQILQEELPWPEAVRVISAVLRIRPDKIDVGFIRVTKSWAGGWPSLQAGNPPLPLVSEPSLRLNRHLWARYVPDAHGIQILTDAHLSLVESLDHWHVETLAPGRHLVMAKDLEPWYSGDSPDDGTLQRARQDFGGMLLTPEIIAANERPPSPELLAKREILRRLREENGR